MELTKASAQWASRPPDERFWSLQELYQATKQHRECAQVGVVESRDLRVEAVDGDIQLVGKTGIPAHLTNWAFTQLSARAKAPAKYLQSLPATLAAQNLNYGLKQQESDGGSSRVLLHKNGGYFARAVLSDKYTRLWNYEIAERLLDLQEQGWRVPPARPYPITATTRIATAEDAKLSLTVREGDVIGPAGLYAGFEDMFAFLIHPDRIIECDGGDGLLRGFFVWNSEVGKSSFGVMKFLFRGVCGNHIVWGAKEVSEIRVRHIGDADTQAFTQLSVELQKYADESATEDENRIKKARQFMLSTTTPQALIDLVFSKMLLSKTTAQIAYDAVIPDVDGDPMSAWGFAQGITRLSQAELNADKRNQLDRAAGKVLELAF